MPIRRAITVLMLSLTWLALAAQLVIDASSDNVTCVCIVCISSLVTFAYLSWTRTLQTHPLSSLAVFGFCVTTQWGALIAKSAFGSPLVELLRQPQMTFATLAAYQLVALASHALYRVVSGAPTTERSPLRRCLEAAQVYAVPGEGQLWIMGLVGAGSMLLHQIPPPIGKIGDAFAFLTWAPFLLPVYRRLMPPGLARPGHGALRLVTYSLLLTALGVLLNNRSIIFTGITSVPLLFLLVGMRSEAPVRFPLVAKLGLCAIGLVVIAGPASDLATAMEIARSGRGKISASEMLGNTLTALQSGRAIAAYRRKNAEFSSYGAYDESYLGNPILGRFVTTKFHDNALYFSRAVSSEDSQRALQKTSEDLLWSILPTPVLNVLGVAIDKRHLQFTMGDYFAYVSRGVPLGGYRTGSVFAEGMALFGKLFFPVYAVLVLVLFYLMDLLAVPRRGPSAQGAQDIQLSALAMMNVWAFFFTGIVNDSLYSVLDSAVRGLIQMIIVYLLTFHATKLLLAMFLRSPARRQGNVPAVDPIGRDGIGP